MRRWLQPTRVPGASVHFRVLGSGYTLIAVLTLPLTYACGAVHPRPEPDPDLLGCYVLETDLPGSYADSLGYEIPGLFRLDLPANGQGAVLPTDEEYRPHWGIHDRPPSGSDEGNGETGLFSRIPGDSIDIVFPGPVGQLVLRVGREDGALRGRAEWIARGNSSFSSEGVSVVAWPSSCDGLENALTRTPDRSTPEEPPDRKGDRPASRFAVDPSLGASRCLS